MHGHTHARLAFEEFVRQYWSPLLQFAIFQGLPQWEAEDAVQEFLAHVAHDSVLRRADPQRGRFRTFLLGALKRSLSHRRTRDTALKRGGGMTAVSIESDAIEDEANTVNETETSFFDRRWAMAMMERALRELEKEYRERGRENVFAHLLRFLPGAQTVESYQTGAADAAMPIGTFKAEVYRVRLRLRERLRSEVAKTVSAPHEIEDEMAYLGRVLMSRSPSS